LGELVGREWLLPLSYVLQLLVDGLPFSGSLFPGYEGNRCWYAMRNDLVEEFGLEPIFELDNGSQVYFPVTRFLSEAVEVGDVRIDVFTD
jgi:hypothetical protein